MSAEKIMWGISATYGNIGSDIDDDFYASLDKQQLTYFYNELVKASYRVIEEMKRCK